jgi:hypothetical protein
VGDPGGERFLVDRLFALVGLELSGLRSPIVTLGVATGSCRVRRGARLIGHVRPRLAGHLMV